MNPGYKRFCAKYGPVADAIASVDIDQEDREAVAEAVGEALHGQPDFIRDTFVLLSSDPLVPCAGSDQGPCPHGRVIRQSFHFSGNPDGTGRSAIWERRAPYGEIRCVSCGSEQFMGHARDPVAP